MTIGLNDCIVHEFELEATKPRTVPLPGIIQHSNLWGNVRHCFPSRQIRKDSSGHLLLVLQHADVFVQIERFSHFDRLAA